MIRYSEPHLLSTEGSDRATAYVHANKIVTLGARTHVVWTDAIACTRGRTYDHAARQWSPVFTVGEGCDNHNDPCLTADREGRLRLVYGPHGSWDHLGRVCDWPSGTFKLVRAETRDSLACLDRDVRPEPRHEGLGYSATYGGLFHTSDGVDAIVYRGGEPPYCAMFQRARPKGGWTPARPIFCQDIAPQYTHYGVQGLCTSKGVIYAGAHFFCAEDAKSSGVAALVSPDGGDTWTDLRGRRLATPAPFSKRIAVPSAKKAADPRLASLALDPAEDLWALTHPFRAGYPDLLLSRWTGREWETLNVAPFLPGDRECISAVLTFDTAGRIHILAAAVEAPCLKRGQNAFGHPTTRLFHLCSRDRGTSFECHAIGPDREGVPTWHPTMSRSALCHPVEKPVFMMTCGSNQHRTDGDCRHTVQTEVYCIFVEEIA